MWNAFSRCTRRAWTRSKSSAGAGRRAKLTYLRKRLGKGATLVKEKDTRGTAAPAKAEKA